MIRVRKGPEPEELAVSGYSADAVKAQLIADQDGKCYLCEREVGTDYEVEHLKSQRNHEKLTNVWTNLFLACSYCNGRKSDGFDEILDPAKANVEQLVIQRYDAKSETFQFETLSKDDVAAALTVQLLGRLFNGLRPKMPTLKEERFRAEFRQAYNLFVSRINAYLENQTEAARTCVLSELAVKAEYLGFKYWLIMSDPHLRKTFEPAMKWNRQNMALPTNRQSSTDDLIWADFRSDENRGADWQFSTCRKGHGPQSQHPDHESRGGEPPHDG